MVSLEYRVQVLIVPNGTINRRMNVNAKKTPKNPDTHVDLKQAIHNLDALPAMPVIAQKLLALQMGTEESEKTMLMLIKQDPQISAKIIGLANTAMLATTRKASTAEEAAMLLGIVRVYSVSIGIAIMSLMHKVHVRWFNIQDLWLHSFGIAFAMTGIARFMPAHNRPKEEQIFLAGLLHDIGYLALAFLDPKRSDKLHERLAANPECPALAIEKKMLELSHDELGAVLANHWNLPAEIITVLRYHHTPDEAKAAAAAGQTLARMVNIAEKLLPSFGFNEYVGGDIGIEEWKALGIDPASAEEIKKVVGEQADNAMQVTSTFT